MVGTSGGAGLPKSNRSLARCARLGLSPVVDTDDFADTFKSWIWKNGGFVIGSIVACETSFEINARWATLEPVITGF